MVLERLIVMTWAAGRAQGQSSGFRLIQVGNGSRSARRFRISASSVLERAGHGHGPLESPPSLRCASKRSRALRRDLYLLRTRYPSVLSILIICIYSQALLTVLQVRAF